MANNSSSILQNSSILSITSHLIMTTDCYYYYYLQSLEANAVWLKYEVSFGVWRPGFRVHSHP